MHLDDFTDSNGHTVTNSGATISNSVYKVGTGSAYFNGNAYAETSAVSNEFEFGSGDFTIEFWIYPQSTTASLFGNFQCSSGYQGGCKLTIVNGKIDFMGAVGTGSNADIVTSTTVLTRSAWAHVAVTRLNGVFNLWINATLEATNSSLSGAIAVANYYTSNRGVRIGATLTDNTTYAEKYTGYLDEIRVWNGTARYTANFTPSTAPFVND